MKEANADLWTYPGADIRVITTNGTIKANGEAVMGRGVALQAKERIPGIAKVLGRKLLDRGNKVNVLIERPEDWTFLWSFPVKHRFNEMADLALIRTSAEQIIDLADLWQSHYTTVPVIALPRPGCNNGRRDWETEVKPIVRDLLDDRFVVVHLAPQLVE